MGFISFFLLLFLFGCSSTGEKRIKHLEEYYQSAGIEQYLLTEVPEWANFFESGQCRRSRSVKFFDFDKITSSLNLNYLEASEFQYSFNVNYYEQTKNNKNQEFKLKDYEFLFYDVFKQISGGKKEFRVPKYPKVAVFWGDNNWQNAKFINTVKQKMTENILPVFLSGCKSAEEIKAELKMSDLEGLSEYIIPQELFSVSKVGYSLNLKKLINADEITLYIPKGNTAKIFGDVNAIKEY